MLILLAGVGIRSPHGHFRVSGRENGLAVAIELESKLLKGGYTWDCYGGS